MKIDEVVQKLQEIRLEHGNLAVHYDDDEVYPSEVEYIECKDGASGELVIQEFVLFSTPPHYK